MTVTPALAAVLFYTGLLTLVLIWLGFVIGQTRQKLKISIGDGGDIEMVRVMRGQANFVENVPMMLLVLLGMALLGAPALLIHALGATLLVARILHGWHFSRPNAPGWTRAAGAGLTILVQFVGALGLIGHGLVNL